MRVTVLDSCVLCNETTNERYQKVQRYTGFIQHKVPGSNPGLKCQVVQSIGWEQLWFLPLPTTLPLNHVSQMAAYSLALHCVHDVCLERWRAGPYFFNFRINFIFSPITIYGKGTTHLFMHSQYCYVRSLCT